MDEKGPRRTEEMARLFCALDLPPATTGLIETWQRAQLAAGAGKRWRPVRPEALHTTLVFLGERPRRRIDAIGAVVESLPAEPVEGRLSADPVAVPRRRPRLLALEVASPAAERLQERLTAGLREAGVEIRERGRERPFWPHITVLRRRGGSAGGARVASAGPLEGPEEGGGHVFGYVRAALYLSEIRSEGSRYSRLATRDLPQPGGLTKR